MDLAMLSMYDLYNHFINIVRAFLNVTRDTSTFLESDEIQAIRNQLDEVLAELRKRRTLSQAFNY